MLLLSITLTVVNLCVPLSIARQLEQLRRGEIITEQEVKELCTKAREILIEESNVQRVDAPVTVNTSWSNLKEDTLLIIFFSAE